MNIQLIGLSLLGVASFLGAWKAIGIIVGRSIAKGEKKKIDELTNNIKDPIIRDIAIKKMKEANEYISSSDGESKMSWVIAQLTAFIPGGLDDAIVRDAFNGIYQGYKDEINKG